VFNPQIKLFTKGIGIDTTTDSQATVINNICTYCDLYPPRKETKSPPHAVPKTGAVKQTTEK
jgi:hypothetical protein